MPDFSAKSEERLLTCHPDIVNICRTVIRDYDFSVLCGYRGEEEQEAAFAAHTSLVRFPNSMHNRKPSFAIDLAPYPIDFDNVDRFHELAGRMLEVAALFDVPLTWGGHWKTFKDYPHYELPKLWGG
jgi:peptidoglycan L-alanyl-D-glutamate endopeptidase CwlK